MGRGRGLGGFGAWGFGTPGRTSYVWGGPGGAGGVGRVAVAGAWEGGGGRVGGSVAFRIFCVWGAPRPATSV